jgi:hypothetical protein
MTTIDPLLKHLVADTAGDSIPLDLHLPSGRLYGHTTSHEDFCRWATNQLGEESGYSGTVAPAPDPEYVHLIVRPVTMPGESPTAEVVRVRLSDVVAWTVG